MSSIKWITNSGILFGAIGMVCGLWMITSPGEERKKNIIKLPYTVRRSRMHNIPVYTDITHGNRKMTVIRKITGDIWVNEVTMSIRVKGYYDTELKAWLTEKGF
ncbi:UNVERIFIED_CONTAM: hypothetical protein FKN15_038733 [Acipenser sinensis]